MAYDSNYRADMAAYKSNGRMFRNNKINHIKEEQYNQSFINRWGRTITRSGGDQCKGGAYSYPAALDRYEKALGLKPDEAWLMKRLLTFDWDGKKYVWCSLRKISQEADVSYAKVLSLKDSLVLKGYIRDQGPHTPDGYSKVREWDINGLLKALTYAILCDPNTQAGKEYAEDLRHPVTMADFFKNGGQPFEPFLEFTTPKQVYEYNLKEGKKTFWDVDKNNPSIPQITERKEHQHTCPECGKDFQTASHNPHTRCLSCRTIVKNQSLMRVAVKIQP